MNFDITEIVQAVISLLTAAITCFFIPFLRQQMNSTKREKLRFWTETAVKAAEQLFGSGAGKEKKEYVVSFLLSKGIVFDVDEVTAMIESSVYALNNSLTQPSGIAEESD